MHGQKSKVRNLMRTKRIGCEVAQMFIVFVFVPHVRQVCPVSQLLSPCPAVTSDVPRPRVSHPPVTVPRLTRRAQVTSAIAPLCLDNLDREDDNGADYPLGLYDCVNAPWRNEVPRGDL